jgi:hypothetical protein
MRAFCRGKEEMPVPAGNINYADDDCSIRGVKVKSSRLADIWRDGIKYKEEVMKKICTAVLLGLWLLFSIGCSSTPSGTEKIANLLKDPESILGKEVVCVGLAETKTSLSSFRMFKLFDGGSFIWVKFPESVEEPPQGYKVRVHGMLLQGEFNIIGKTYYIEANKISME